MKITLTHLTDPNESLDWEVAVNGVPIKVFEAYHYPDMLETVYHLDIPNGTIWAALPADETSTKNAEQDDNVAASLKMCPTPVILLRAILVTLMLLSTGTIMLLAKAFGAQ
jgi:hypothetical protein